jgi:hypothetical protein
MGQQRAGGKPPRVPGSLESRQPRTLVLAVALAVLLAKLYVAKVTFGTNDVRSWMNFAGAVKRVGPVRVYGYPFPHDLYNHPPLVGYFLMVLNYLARLGMPLSFTLRSCSSLADVGSALLVYELVRRRRSERDALASGILTAVSPILFIVSGFHGNTDPIFVMLLLLGLYALVDRNSAFVAGLVIAMSVSIKLVPVVVIPAMLSYAYRQGRAVFARFAFALLGLGGLIWAPAVILEWGPFRHNVLGYTGVTDRWWGIPQFATWSGRPGTGTLIAAKGSLLIVATIAGAAALVAVRRPHLLVEIAALSMCGFLLMSPAIGTQYMVWALAPAYLISLGRATVFNLGGGALLFSIYNRWAGGFPWDIANGSPPTPDERLFASVVWVTLLMVVLRGIWIVSGSQRRATVDEGVQAVGNPLLIG